jgi:hypothetical protein
VEFQFLDTELGILATREGLIAQMLAPDQVPLHTAFSYFEGGKNLEIYLLAPKGRQADSQFSSAVSWLLELCGFRTLNLSALPDAEHLRIDGKEEGSCDIIAAAESSPASLLLVDCTTAVPRQDKFARIRLTAEEIAKQAASLFERLQVTVRPVIAVSKDVPALWNETPFAPFFDVTVFSCSAGLGDNDLIYFPILCKTSHLRGYRNYKEERIITPRIRSLPVP